MNDESQIKGDIGLSWVKLLDAMFFTYNGYRSERVGMGRYRYKENVYTIYEFMDFVDEQRRQGAKAIANSIKSK